MDAQKRTLTQGKMTKDVDERLLPNGQYYDAENIRISRKEGNDMGVGKSVKGNVRLTNLKLEDARTIGVFADSSSNKLYYFVTSHTKDLVLEYDYFNSNLNIVLESTRPDGVLNFDKEHLIIGVNKIFTGNFKYDLLAWTDNYNPPRIINIERAKNYGVDNFSEQDLSVIKRPPIYAIKIDLTYTSTSIENNLEDKYLSFAYRYKYLDNEYSALSPFSIVAFAPKPFDLDYQTMKNNGMLNAFNAVRINFDTGSKHVTDIQIVFKETNSINVHIIESFNKKELGWNDNSIHNFLFSNSKKYTTLPKEEIYRTFDNVPLLAKCQELVGNRLVYSNYLEGYDLIDQFGSNLAIDYSLSLKTKSIAGKKLTLVVKGKKLSINLSSVPLLKNSKITIAFDLEGTFIDGKAKSDAVFILNQNYSTIKTLVEDSDFKKFVEIVMSNAFFSIYEANVPSNHEILETIGFKIDGYVSSVINILAPTITYREDLTPTLSDDQQFTNHISEWSWKSNTTTVQYNATAVATSLKTERDYEVGLIYKDSDARSSTVLTCANNTLFIPLKYSVQQNKINVYINHKPPYWAKNYVFTIKQNKLNYETIYCNLFYEDGLFRWVKLEGANKDKVKDGSILIVKSDLNGVLENTIEVPVLEVATKDKDFIESNENVDGDQIVEESGVYMKIKPKGFDMNFNDSTSRTFEGGSHLRYPVRTHTNPIFGEIINGVFKSYKLGAGSIVQIKLSFEARGSIAYRVEYDKTFRVSSPYNSIQEWFDNEVDDLGAFGEKYCRGDKGIGYGFTKNGERFYIWSHRDGTASRKITSNLSFEVIATEGTVIFETKATEIDTNIFYETSQIFDVVNGNHLGNIQNQFINTSLPAIIELDIFNCYVQGNGAESYKIKDTVAGNFLNFDLRPTSTSIEKYKSVRRFADFTYSDPYVESSTINGLNVFNLAKANYKDDLDKKYGTVQKIYAKDTNLVVFQEDKVHKVLYGKDVLYNADGTSNISSIENVLGQHIAYAGEYGISRNPESFSSHGNHIYFTDAKRGYVLRLGIDGITEISGYGMRTWFKDLFKNSLEQKKVGAFDPYFDAYVLGSEGVSIFNPNVILDCSKVYLKLELEGETSFKFDYGFVIGEAGFSYKIEGAPAIIELKWNGQIFTTGAIEGDGQLLFDKNTPISKTARIKISVPKDCASIRISGICPIGEEITIIPIVVADSTDKGKTIRNRFKWFTNTYVSNYKNYETRFTGQELNLYEVLNGTEGDSFFAPKNSIVRIESFKGYTNTGSFEQDDRLGYYISNTLISKDNYHQIIDKATWLNIAKTEYITGDVLNVGVFNLKKTNNEKYLYLIWDYIKKNTPPVAITDNLNCNRGSSITADLRLNDYDEDNDPLSVEIFSQPIHGSVIVNPNGTVTYTHDGSNNFDDEFIYRVFDGKEYSNNATVYLAIGVPCQDGLAANGTIGVYEVTISLGTDIGEAGISYDAFSIPDRFMLEYDGVIVADSKYVGNSLINSGYPDLSGSKSLDVYEYNGNSFINTLKKRIITVNPEDIANGSISEPKFGKGTLLFNKTVSTPTTVKLIVIGFVGGTAWNISGICPNTGVQ
ncbi:Ig-like domain-containing protein [Aquimarina longa]|uniref:Ig-like domain-containing protein n=1 Tax=Aquimarina longa TaxID=1080221 RepID=UPI000781D648|nr:Ig-like domain-containing protein [Aquimarina longa]